MRRISVAQLRQNPTQALNEAAGGVPSEITKHGRVVARLMPPEPETWVDADAVQDVIGPREDAWLAEIEAERDRWRLDPDA